MSNPFTRRTAIALPVTLPLLPVPAFAASGNATDAAWGVYKAAIPAARAGRRGIDAHRLSRRRRPRRPDGMAGFLLSCRTLGL